jgi:GAF domain-containing protein
MTPAQRAAALRLAAYQETLARTAQATNTGSGFDFMDTAALLRQLAAEPVQKPILWYRDFGAGPMICNPDRPDALPLYPHAPQQRQPLTIDQIAELTTRAEFAQYESPMLLDFARAVEAAHGIGETK